jgi:Ca-activated chloride channel family protein
MTAQDFTPNRMEAAKTVAANFVERRVTDRIGIVIIFRREFYANALLPPIKRF